MSMPSSATIGGSHNRDDDVETEGKPETEFLMSDPHDVHDTNETDHEERLRRLSKVLSSSNDDEHIHVDRGDGGSEGAQEKDAPVTWNSLPRKGQLVILTLARLSEPLVQTSLQSYVFYQLKSFDESLSDSVIASQAGMLSSAFTGAQFLTAMLWGRLSDSSKVGRKMVLVIGLLGTLLSVIGFGFSQRFWQAMVFRLMGGALNGNIGVLRTMVSEIILEKKYQSRAFLIFPMSYNIGVIIGPVLGGLLADPEGSYPSIFGGNKFLIKFPYAAPNLLSAFFLFMSANAVFFGLEETLPSIRHKEDFGSKCTRKIAELFHRRRSTDGNPSYAYAPISGNEQSQGPLRGSDENDNVEMSPIKPTKERRKAVPRFRRKLPFRRIFTHNVVCTLLSHFLFGLHLGTFNSLWFVFLSTAVDDPAHPKPPDYVRRLPFIFSGGLGMPPRDVGFAMAILGVLGIALQLIIYPRITSKVGIVLPWRITLYAFPIAYILVPFLALVPSKTPPPAEKDGLMIWMSLLGILCIQVTGRTFALPANIILVNNCTPHPSVLGTIHGIGQSTTSAAHTIGPLVGGVLFGLGLSRGVVGAVWWGLSGLAIINCIASNFVRDGDGHEIKLEGDDEAEAEFQADLARRKAGK